MRNTNVIKVIGAREKNLKNISVEIPKKKITVFTGVSGSGKSSLVFDTIGTESQRQLNETYSSFIRNRLPHYGEPNVDQIENLPVSFIINQKRLGGNARSTVGTATDVYSLLRLLFSRIGKPFVGYSDVFSFNNPSGMCKHCQGLGKVDIINIEKLLDKDKSLNEGAILFPGFEVDGWRITRYLRSGLFNNNKKLRDFTDEEMDLLLYRNDYKLPSPDPEYPKNGIYEGVIPRIKRSFLSGESKEVLRNKEKISNIVTKEICLVCHGARLNENILSCKIEGLNIDECSSMEIKDLLRFMNTIHEDKVLTVLNAIKDQLTQLISVGLGYLSLNRETKTLSGGESQRIKLVKQLGSSLSDVLYIFDEPSIGLHPFNVDKINNLLKLLKEKGNTILIIEHDPDIIKIADYIIEMGPLAGTEGGEVVFNGSYEKFEKSETLTSKNLYQKIVPKKNVRTANGYINIENATLHNLKDITVKIPKEVLTVVTGVAGSGKSSLINGVLLNQFPNAISIDQKGVYTSKRSNIATFVGIFDYIRKLFANKNSVKMSLFSYNSEGACPICKGLGKIYTDLAFMDTVATTCDACDGKRYIDSVLEYKYNGKNISEVLNMTIQEASSFFSEKQIKLVLKSLLDVGVGYITLGQPLNTLSGGELQRIKLAAELENDGNMYILDEPTTGLHMSDIKRLMKVLNRMVDHGNTLIIIEHNMDVISEADWIIDMGPGAGQDGGDIVFEGTPREVINSKKSITGQYLKKYCSF